VFEETYSCVLPDLFAACHFFTPAKIITRLFHQ
jgi:hypothetical protein